MGIRKNDEIRLIITAGKLLYFAGPVGKMVKMRSPSDF